MAAGDFLDVYNEAEYVGSLDAVVTCFFMDCAHNILDFMQTIHRVIRCAMYTSRFETQA
jgi:carnosine N-methyltransferase